EQGRGGRMDQALPARGRRRRERGPSHSRNAVVSDTHRAIEAVWRIESAKLIAGLTRLTRDVGLAEDLAQEALVAALEQWPASGIPENPGAWLMGTAKHRAIDQIRRSLNLEQKYDQIGRDLETREELDLDAAIDDDIGDDLL